MHTGVLAAISIALSVLAQFTLKAGVGRAQLGAGAAVQGALTEPLVWGGLALYGASALLWLLVLADWDVSKAYPLVGGGFVLAAFVGHALGEPMGLMRLAGVLMISLGVAIVARS